LLLPSPAVGTARIYPGISSRYEVRKLDLLRSGLEVAGERSPRADQRRAALHVGMGDILKIVRCGAIGIPRGRDGRDFHPVSAIRAGEHETRQVRWSNVLVMHAALPGSSPPASNPRPI
jgi:hypothetical protein